MFNVHRTPNRMNPNQQPKTARSEPTPIRRPPPLQTSALPASRRSPPAPLPPSGLPPSATVTARPPVRGRPDRARARGLLEDRELGGEHRHPPRGGAGHRQRLLRLGEPGRAVPVDGGTV